MQTHNQQQPNNIKQGHTNRIKEKQLIIVIINTPKNNQRHANKNKQKTKTHRHSKQSKTATNKDMRKKSNKNQRCIIVKSNEPHESKTCKQNQTKNNEPPSSKVIPK